MVKAAKIEMVIDKTDGLPNWLIIKGKKVRPNNFKIAANPTDLTTVAINAVTNVGDPS